MTEVHPNARPVEVPGAQAQAAYTEWARQLVEGLMEAERRWLELAAAQNELVFGAIRQAVEALRSAPTVGLGEWARQGLENFMQVQRSWTGNFEQQRAQFMNNQLYPGAEMGATPPGAMPGMPGMPGMPPTAQVVGMMTQPVELLADARRRWLEFAAKQNAQVVEGVKRALNVREGTPAATYMDWTQDAVNSYVEFQKRWLDLLGQFPAQLQAQMPGPAPKKTGQ